MKYILELIVFLCGASLMMLELVGSRVLAPYVGTSTIIWTSLIGIILAFLSLGYWWGGKLADRGASYKKLALVILIGAFFVFLIIIINQPVLHFIRVNIKNVYLGVVVATLVLFSIPGFLLGIVSPYAFRLKIKKVEESGRTAGRLYAISTLGSIVGTFSAGFWLIPFFGTVNVLYFITFILLFSAWLSFSCQKNSKELSVVFIVFFLIFSFFFLDQTINKNKKIIDVDSQYNRILIYESVFKDSGRPVLLLTTDPYSTQSGMFLDKGDDPIFEYLKYYRLAGHFKPDLNSVLLIGGAAYAHPKDFLKRHPEALIDVVEIDPKMTELARKYFKLKDDPRLSIYHQDGRVFLNSNQKKYDVVFIDAFNSRLSVPYQLTTLEALEEVNRSLNDDGLVLLNIISAFSGKKSKFLRAEYLTYKKVFPRVYLFQVNNVGPEEIQNIILVAFKAEEPPSFYDDGGEFDEYLKKLWTEEIETDLPILTDDHAPVEYYMMNA